MKYTQLMILWMGHALILKPQLLSRSIIGSRQAAFKAVSHERMILMMMKAMTGTYNPLLWMAGIFTSCEQLSTCTIRPSLRKPAFPQQKQKDRKVLRFNAPRMHYCNSQGQTSASLTIFGMCTFPAVTHPNLWSVLTLTHEVDKTKNVSFLKTVIFQFYWLPSTCTSRPGTTTVPGTILVLFS